MENLSYFRGYISCKFPRVQECCQIFLPCFYTMHSLYACFQFRCNAIIHFERHIYIYVYIRFKEIHINTHVLSRSIYTIGNTENNNWSPLNKLNPEQYRSSNNTNNTFGRELKTLALQIFAFVSLAVKLPSLYPSNDERAERVDSNLVPARVIFNSIFVCTL